MFLSSHNNLLKPPPGKALVKLGKLGILLLDELSQFVDTLDLFVTDGGVGNVLLFHLTKPEYLIGDVLVVLLAGSVVDKLLLKFGKAANIPQFAMLKNAPRLQNDIQGHSENLQVSFCVVPLNPIILFR